MFFYDKPPKEITIMADYGTAYAWDEEGAGIGLSEHFQDSPEVARIEAELEAWARWFSTADEFDPKFPWQEFHQKGLALAQCLYQAIKYTNVPVYYWSPFEDPARGKAEKIAITEEAIL